MPILKRETDHYTAVIKVFRVDKVVTDERGRPVTRDGSTLVPETPTPKENHEVAAFNIRNSDLETLVTKAIAHLNLVEDDE